MTSKSLVVQEAIIEELVENNQLLTKVNKLIEPSTILTDKVELIELPKDSVLTTGFRFTDLSILSDVFSLMACPIYSTAKTLLSFSTLKTRKKNLQDLCKLSVDTVNLSITFTIHLRLTTPQ